MINNKRKLTLGIVTGITIISIPVATVVSCGNTTSEKHMRKANSRASSLKKTFNYSEEQSEDFEAFEYNEMINKYKDEVSKKYDDNSQSILDKKAINIVSLGDSVSAGYSQLDAKDHRGYSKNGKITGISYGSYIARALQTKGKLGEFNNFGIGGATTSTLRNQLDPSFKLRFASKIRSDLINAKLVAPEPGETERFKKVREKIQKADLVTISIGANDILSTIKLGGLTIDELLSKGIESLDMSGGMNSLVTYDKATFETAILKAKANFAASVLEIKQLNPNAKIIAVGYPLPVTQLASVLKIVKTSDGQSLAGKILAALDSVGKSFALGMKTVDFIDGYIEKTWDENAIKLAPELIDIHPGPRGYKMMAATILATLSHYTNIPTKFKHLTSRPFSTTDSKIRLHEDYDSVIADYININSSLTTEEKAVQDLAKPYKLIHFAADIIPKVVGALKNSMNPTSPTGTATSNYGLDPSALLAQIKPLLPFVGQILKSGETGLNSSKAEINKGVKQDALFILATLYDVAESFKTGIVPLVKMIVVDSQISKYKVPQIAKFIKDNENKLETATSRTEILKKGPASDYVK